MATVAPTLTAALKGVAAAFPSRRAVVVPGKLELTHADLDALVGAAAARLTADAGVLPGQVVALVFPNTVELVVMLLAVIRAGAVPAPLNPAFTEEEFEFYLSDSDARLVVTSAEGNAAAQAAAAKLGRVHAAASLQDAAGPVHLAGLPAESHAGNGNGSKGPGLPATNNPSDAALLLHTSGSTRRPMGAPVLLTQGNLAASVHNIRSAYRLAETDATVAVLPLFHVHGLLCGLLASLASGASVTLPAAGRFSASTFWADMRASGATWYAAVPTIHQILLSRHATEHEAQYPALRFIRSCGEPLAPGIGEKLEAAFGAPVLEAYAMAGTAHLTTSKSTPLLQDGRRKGTASLDDDVARGMAGEVRIRILGDGMAEGYKNTPEANSAVFRFGPFHTGGTGVVDEEEYLHLLRLENEIIRSSMEVNGKKQQAVPFGLLDDKHGGDEVFSFEKAKDGLGQNDGGFTEQLRQELPVLGLSVASVAMTGVAAGAVTPATGLGLFVMLIVGLSAATIRVLRA